MEISESLAELYEERAAILEYEAGWPRAIAESEARRRVTRLAWLAGECRPGWIQPPARAEKRNRPALWPACCAETGGRCWD